jgi:GDP/UDP-N,N'-diacetylbacillosamine 2-epimerase (hydrolysing)
MSEIIKALEDSDQAETCLVINGVHQSKNFGNSIIEIEDSNIKNKIELKIEYSSNIDNDLGVISSEILSQFSDAIQKFKPDYIVLVGDRFETMVSALAGYLKRVEIIHFHGGEKTIGSFDDSLRHAITKLSDFHFVASPEYKKRIEQLGEDPSSIFEIGNLVGFKIASMNFIKLDELQMELNFIRKKRNVLVTLHPETGFEVDNRINANELVKALDALGSDTNIFITSPNADPGAFEIRQVLEEFSLKRENTYFFPSLGQSKYLSLMHFCDLVIGNSSSGVIESPMLGVPSINLGIRQTGRVIKKGVYNCPFIQNQITNKINEAIETKDALEKHFDYLKYDKKTLINKLLTLDSHSKPKIFQDLNFI